MTFVSIAETFAAVVVALGGLECFKWIKRTWFPKKTELRLDESEAAKSEVEVQQAVQDIQKTIMDIDSARIKELREANTIVNQQNVDLNKQIAELNKQIAELNAQHSEYQKESQKEIARLNEIITDKVTHIRKGEEKHLADIKYYEERITAMEKEHKVAILALQKEYEEKITELTRQLGHQEKLAMFYRTWHCEREYGRGKENCLRRKPAQEPPLKYCPPELIVTEFKETEPLIIPEDCTQCKTVSAKPKSTKSKK